MACAIAVMAKVPQPGRSKTRLVPPFSPENAAALSAAFLRDMTENLRILSESVPIAPYVAYAPAGAESHFGTTLAPGTNLLLADGRADIPATVAGFGRCLLHALQGRQPHPADIVFAPRRRTPGNARRPRRFGPGR
jgi:hypothetical protein